MTKFNQHKLPKRRRRDLIEWLDNTNVTKLVFYGLTVYLIITLVFSSGEFLGQSETCFIKSSTIKNSFSDFLYFNFVTILTIGYGDYAPTGVFRIFSIMEAILGLGVFSLLISFLTVKSLLPRKTTIVFSQYGYYSLKEQRFMVIYLNTANEYIINSETCSYVKIGGDWKVKQAVKAPFITKSVQTFFLDEVRLELMRNNYTAYDCLRIGITGSIGIANYSTSVEYRFQDIVVIENRKVLSNYTGFWEVDKNIDKPEFAEHFHYNPPGAKKLYDYLREW